MEYITTNLNANLVPTTVLPMFMGCRKTRLTAATKDKIINEQQIIHDGQSKGVGRVDDSSSLKIIQSFNWNVCIHKSE
jgi:hypothetical protein